MSSVLFLDIDGVLLPFGSYNDWYLAEATGHPGMFMTVTAQRCVGTANIKKFCDDNDAKIVLISTWRYIFQANDLLTFLIGAGLESYLHEDWIAVQPTVFRCSKLHDINCWIADHQETRNWWIIDDQDQGVSEEHWIKTDPYKGFVD